MKVGVVALQGDFAEHLGCLSSLGVDTLEVRGPTDLSGLDALVLPGGESTTMSMLLASSGLWESLSEAHRAGLPMLGTCAGMILLASDVADGRADQRRLAAIDIGVRRNGYGRQAMSFECDLPVDGIAGDPIRAVFIRAPVVERVGGGVEVLAELGEDRGGARSSPVLCRQGPVMVAAFHPELGADSRVHELFLSTVS